MTPKTHIFCFLKTEKQFSCFQKTEKLFSKLFFCFDPLNDAFWAGFFFNQNFD